jgi:excisionase family DNA binding protein
MGRGNYGAPIVDAEIEPDTQTETQKNPAPGYKKPLKRLLSTSEAAAYLGISEPTFRKYRKLGQIPFRRVGEKLYKYHPDDLDQFEHKIARRGA